MAYTYNNLPLLSKVQIDGQLYYLKDAEVRAIMDTFGDAVTYNVDTTFNPSSNNLATSSALAAHIQNAVAGLTGAMHFVGVKDALPLSGANGDVVIVGTAEYVWSDAKDGGAGWILIGDEGVYATVSGVEAAYVKKELTIAGIDLKDAITVAELQGALGLGSLAYQNSASGMISDFVTGVKDAQYTPAGSVAVNLDYAVTSMNSTGNFTPAGTITGDVTAAGAVEIIRDQTNGTAITGTVSAPTVTVTPATAQIQHIDDLGQLPSYTAAQYTAPSVSEASSQFAAEGLVATVNDEELILTAATKAAALTSTGFNAGSYTAAQFNAGALPTFGAAQTVVTGIQSAVASAPTFTGDKFAATFAGQNVAINAAFAGTQGVVNVAGDYDKANVQSASFTGTQATISHGVDTATKSVTVQ